MFKQTYRVPYSPVAKGCVYRLSFGSEDDKTKRYVIVKAKTMETSATQIQRSLNQFIRETAGQNKTDNLYYHLFTYVKENPEGEFSYEILFESENAYQLLVEEQKALKKARKDQNCLNNNIEAYIPQYNEVTEKYGWISKGDVLNFKKWLLRNPVKKKVAKKKSKKASNKR